MNIATAAEWVFVYWTVSKLSLLYRELIDRLDRSRLL